MIQSHIAGVSKLFLEGAESKYFRLVGHMVFVTATQLYHYKVKAIIDKR